MSAEGVQDPLLGARLGLPATSVEVMSVREIDGWLRFFGAQQAGANDEEAAVPLEHLSRDQLRGMFPG